MAVQTGKSTLAAKLGNRLTQAHAETKGKPVEAGNPQLPAGIENGVAQLRDVKIGEYKEGVNKGQPYFMASAVVLEPKEVDGISVAGLRTQIGPEALCDTPQATGKRKTFQDHYKFMRDQLSLIGFDLDQLSGTPQQIEAGILSGMAALTKQQPTFRFRTWKGKKQTTGPYAGQEPRVQHEWNGLVEFSTNGEAAPDVVDDTPSADEVPAAEPGDNTGEELDVDLDSLIEAAKGDDVSAQEQLQKIAFAAGISEDDYSAADWDGVKALIEAAQGVEAPAAEPEPQPPVKGGVYGYHPQDPKTKKPGKKQVDCEVTAVDVKTETVTLKRLDTKTVVKGVKWADLKNE